MLFLRDIQTQIVPWMTRPEIIVILGTRQSGKTSLIKLLQKDLDPVPSIYLDLEDTFSLKICENVTTFLDYLHAQGYPKKEKVVCFIDEIQYHPNPSKFLKLLHDHSPNIKLTVTGSSSFEIRRKFKESLAGRKITFHLHPLSFTEYLRFTRPEFARVKSTCSLQRALENPQQVQKYHTLTPQLLPLFESFLIFGGYPRIALESDFAIKKQLLQELYNTYIQKDIKDLAKIGNIVKFNKLTSFLAVQMASLFRMSEAAKEIGLAQPTLENYLFLLENTFTLSLVRPFAANLQKELTKMPKLFFLDNGMRNALINDFRQPDLRPDLGALAENACFAELKKTFHWIEKINYWRTVDGKEIDFILTLENKSLVPVEVKYKNVVPMKLPPAMKYFIQHYAPLHAVILTKSLFAQKRFASTQVLFLPLWMI